ncbi:PQQ-binding-like beta-propeller repeat protein [Hyphomicrobiales bacterium]|nr:PQQ-binding-like beta-propeller repeat protein [Hyphomicrobiales bacterium]
MKNNNKYLGFFISLLFLNYSFSFEAVISQELTKGQALYEEHCSDCHSLSLRGTAHGSSLLGEQFINKWEKEGFENLLSVTKKSMPPGKQGLLSNETYSQIHQYILASNDQEVDESWVAFSDPSTINQEEERKTNFKNKPILNFKNITLKDINNPPPSDWLSWRRTVDGQGHSPLNIINTENVNNLKLSWSLSMSEGSNQITPLVSQGIMFLTNPGNTIQALDAKNGELIWEYSYPFPKGSKTLGGPTRNIAVFEDKIFMATYDASIIALDIKTGKLLWKSQKADFSDGYTHTSGPIIANGVVVSGINGCERYIKEGCFITGHNPDNGDEIWRTSTIAQPGSEHGDTWGDTESIYRAGGDTWIPGSYDPKLNLFFIGTSQAKPWVADSRGMTTEDSALYTNSTLAINPNTGKIEWFYQHIPGETIDMEVGFERVLVDYNNEKLLYTIGKDGILWKMNRENGKFISLLETVNQNIYQNINYKTGKLTYRDDILNSKINKSFSVCPGIYGGHNWQAVSYDKKNNALIIPLHQLCADMIGREVEKKEGFGGFGADSRSYEKPGVNGKVGQIISVDLNNMEINWSHEQEAMFLTSSLTTAGGITFIGDLDRYFKAFNSKTGEVVWKTRLSSALHGFPITYSIGNKQYVAITTGMGVFRALTSLISPQIYQPDNGNAIYVFELESK